MSFARVQQSPVQSRFVAQQQQSFGIGVKAADWVYAFRESKIAQRSVGGTVGRELGEHVERFVESQKQRFLYCFGRVARS